MGAETGRNEPRGGVRKKTANGGKRGGGGDCGGSSGGRGSFGIPRRPIPVPVFVPLRFAAAPVVLAFISENLFPAAAATAAIRLCSPFLTATLAFQKGRSQRKTRGNMLPKRHADGPTESFARSLEEKTVSL